MIKAWIKVSASDKESDERKCFLGGKVGRSNDGGGAVDDADELLSVRYDLSQRKSVMEREEWCG